MPNRIVFDLTDEELERALPFIDQKKYAGHHARKAFLEWISRRESRRDRADRQKKAELR